MDDRDLIRMDRGFGEQAVFDVLLDFGPEDVGRREVLENGSGNRKTVRNEGARNVTDNVAQWTVIGGTIARSTDAEKRQNHVAANAHRGHTLGTKTEKSREGK